MIDYPQSYAIVVVAVAVSEIDVIKTQNSSYITYIQKLLPTKHTETQLWPPKNGPCETICLFVPVFNCDCFLFKDDS